MKEVLVGFFLFFTAATVQAQELHNEVQEIVLARVTKIVREENAPVPGTNVNALTQSIEAEILEGGEKGKTVEIRNDFLKMEVGDKFYVSHVIDINGFEYYEVHEAYRLPVIYTLIAVFILAILVFGGFQGLRALFSLLGSLFIITYLLLPQLLAGASPLLLAVGFSIFILILAIYVTHGINRKATAALLGTIITILITIVLAEAAVSLTNLSGFADDEAVYLNFNTAGELDIGGLLLAAIILGVLGVLDDVAITQASAVEELHRSAPELARRDIFRRAYKIGKEHVGALVNTLALVYLGSALPLLLLFYGSPAPLHLILNREIVATEIVRMVVGSIGVIMAVPIATALSVFMLVRKDKGA